MVKIACYVGGKCSVDWERDCETEWALPLLSACTPLQLQLWGWRGYHFRPVPKCLSQPVTHLTVPIPPQLLSGSSGNCSIPTSCQMSQVKDDECNRGCKLLSWLCSQKRISEYGLSLTSLLGLNQEWAISTTTSMVHQAAAIPEKDPNMMPCTHRRTGKYLFGKHSWTLERPSYPCFQTLNNKLHKMCW